MPKSAMGVMKEYAEKPFRLWDMRGKQFTIVEDLPKTKVIREVQKKAFKTGKPYTAYLIKVQEGMFEKDLELLETQLETLFLKMPTSLINFKGAVMTLTMDVNPVLTYIGQVTQDMNENFAPKPAQIAQDAPQSTKDQKEGLFYQLAQAITFSAKIGIVPTEDKVIQIAQNICKDDPRVFIQAAKMAGWVIERDGIYTGTA